MGICHWFIGDNTGTARATYTAHSDVVEDVAWHPLFESYFASVGDDHRLMIWDVRDKTQKPGNAVNAHEREVNSVAFNPFNQWVLATGSSDKTVALWDLRKLSQSLHSFQQ